MNAIRTLGVSAVAAAIAGSAAVGLAGTAGATTVGSDVRPPLIVATPDTKAQPAPEIMPGHYWHHGIYRESLLAPYGR